MILQLASSSEALIYTKIVWHLKVVFLAHLMADVIMGIYFVMKPISEKVIIVLKMLSSTETL